MGNNKSTSLHNRRRSVTRSNRENIRIDSAAKYDEKTVEILQNDLEQTPEIFLLNNLLMSFMFFENHKKEQAKLCYSSSTRMEKELNPRLLREETIKCITPDIIFEEVNRNIEFSQRHGPRKHIKEPLIPKRIFVVNDNIEVLDMMDMPDYTVIDKPSCQVRPEETNRKGFIKLRKNDESSKNFTDKILVIEPQPGPSNLDDNYDYTRIEDIKTPKLLEIVNCERRYSLPESCFSIKKIRKYRNLDEIDENENEPDHDLYESVSYISSKGFMNHFQNAIFPNSLATTLGFTQVEINEAKAIPGAIFCRMQAENMFCEIIPAVAMQWPASQTFEFDRREERPTITDKQTGIRYRWPTEDMIRELKATGSVLIPRGFYQKRGENFDCDIEWEIAFPKAERLIDTKMSQTQMRCFLSLIALFKTYIEPVTQQYGLLIDHLRIHMYWECESNPRDWPEHRLGTKILKVIYNLHLRLAKCELSHYFIKQKNVFENIPKKFLLYAQKILHKTLESPVIYFLGALRNFSYKSRKFYPIPDFKEFYHILTTEAVKSINQNLLPEHSAPPNYRRRRSRPGTNRISEQENDWRHQHELENRKKMMERRRKEKEQLEKLAKEQRKLSIDSIDFECKFKDFDLFRIRQLLCFFIKHFIEMAKTSRKLSTNNQTLFYLKQAYYLSKILEDRGLAADAKDFLDVIAKEEEDCKKMNANGNVRESPPPTPCRNSNQIELIQQVKNKSSSLNNLSKSWTNISCQSSRINMIRNQIKSMEEKKSVGFL